MKKNDFISVIGYQGNVALMDKKLRAQLASYTMQQLIDEGQFKAAFCLSFFTGEDERNLLLNAYNTLCKGHYSTKDLEKLFGVYAIPQNIKTQPV